MEPDASKLRSHAAYCRRLAAGTYDGKTRDILHSTAEEFEAEALKKDGNEGAVLSQAPPVG